MLIDTLAGDYTLKYTVTHS